MKHVADVLAVIGGLALILAGFTITVTVGLAVIGLLCVAAAVVVAKTSPTAVEGSDGA